MQWIRPTTPGLCEQSYTLNFAHWLRETKEVGTCTICHAQVLVLPASDNLITEPHFPR